jgi:two-component system response regulator GlrR
MYSKRKEPESVKTSLHIALIEDDEDQLLFLQAVLETEGHQVTAFLEGGKFLETIEDNPDTFDLVLSDYLMPQMDGLQLYAATRKVGLSCPFLLLTAFGDFDVAVQALKAGIADYILKPIKEDALLSKVASYIEHRTLEEEVLFNRLGKRIVAQSPAMQEILRRLSRLAKSRASILFTGESGTGKEVLSRMLHDISPRSECPFVGVNVSAIPETLFEAEFFGYRKGAFTDALRDHDGYARMADKGTLFLDELGELSPSSQAKLLRLLEERKVQPLGDRQVHDVDFRVISATNRDLHQQIQNGAFRDDLFYRLAVITIHIPPLRERPEDIIPLARHLLHQLSKEEELDIIDFTPDAQEALLAYQWPGNIRELKNRVHEALLATDQKWIEASHLYLPDLTGSDERPLSYAKAKANFEKHYVTRLLKVTSGNVNRIADLAGLSRKAVYDMMKRHEISPEMFRR